MADKNVDVLISAPQKGWSGSPCCAFVMLSERAREGLDATTSSSFAMDLKKWLSIMETHEQGKIAYHATLPTDGLAHLRDAMQETAALGFAAYLSAFTESSVGPMDGKRLQMVALLEAVSEQLQRLETSTALELMTPEPEVPAPAPTVAAGKPEAPAPEAPAAPDTIVFIDPTGRDAGVLGMELEEFGYQVQPLLRLDRQTAHWLNQPQVKALILPVAGDCVRAGFPSPAEDFQVI